VVEALTQQREEGDEVTKTYDLPDNDGDLTLKVITRAHEQIIARGIHYGDCDLVTVKGPCSCMAAFDAGVMIGAIIKNRAEYEY
jgi:hypothetical protein